MAEHEAWVRQGDYTVLCEWGHNAIEALAPDCDVVLIVDVLSFTTCVDLAVARGADVSLAAALDCSSCVPVLERGVYCASSVSASTRSR